MTQRKDILRFGICMLAGALCTVAGAWWISISTDIKASSESDSFVGYDEWIEDEYRAASLANRRRGALLISAFVESESEQDSYYEEARARIRGGAARLPAPSWIGAFPKYDSNVERRQYHLMLATGWPCLALSSEFLVIETDPPSRFRTGHAIELRASSNLTKPPSALPLRPLWPGFAWNTLFYGLSILAVSTVLRVMIRRRRLRRGQCPACSYVIGQSPVCTECGHLIRRRDPR